MVKTIVIIALIIVVLLALRWLWRRYTSVALLPKETREFVARRGAELYYGREGIPGHITLFYRHCHKRMVAVWVRKNTSLDPKQDPQYEYERFQAKVCQNLRCGYAKL
ncbi:MAG: hypothetical protein PHV43_03265 [Candidatus Colwellbacteria bacterium]|nr:hypothetical protein [Candidatus Colwellbacteria bacterium]